MTRLCTGLQMLVKLDHIGHAAPTSCRTILRMSCQDAYQLYRTINIKLCVVCRFNGRPTQHAQQVQKPLQMHGVIIRIRIDTSRIFVDRKLWPRVHAAARDFGTQPQISACIVRSLSTSQLTVQHLWHIGCCVCGLLAGSVCPDRPRSQIALVLGSRDIICAALLCIYTPARQVRLCFIGNASPCLVAIRFRKSFYCAGLPNQNSSSAFIDLYIQTKRSLPLRGSRSVPQEVHTPCSASTNKGSCTAGLAYFDTSICLNPNPNCIACKAVLQFHHCLLCSVYITQRILAGPGNS